MRQAQPKWQASLKRRDPQAAPVANDGGRRPCRVTDETSVGKDDQWRQKQKLIEKWLQRNIAQGTVPRAVPAFSLTSTL